MARSKADAASSKIIIFGDLASMRASAILYLSPPESFTPFSPTTVCKPLGHFETEFSLIYSRKSRSI